LTSGPYRVGLLVSPLFAATCLLLFARHLTPVQLADVLVIGALYGAMFGQTTVAGAWAVFGPGPLIWRLPLSLLWIALLAGGWEFNVSWKPGLGTEGVGGVMGTCLLVQWLVLQVLLWPAALGGVRLTYRGDAGQKPERRAGQFSLLHLLGLMVIAGIGITIGRLLQPVFVAGYHRVGEWPIYRALSLGAIVMNLPLLIASLLPRWSIPATLLALVPIGLATFWEPYFLNLVGESILSNRLLLSTNGLTALWVLAFAAAVRLSGYRLGRAASSAAPAQP
jgi:hypothetical protein